MINILIVSHSYKFAQGLFLLISSFKFEDFEFDFIGGMEDKISLGTRPMLIQEKIESLLKNENDKLLIFCDLGSSIINTQYAIKTLKNIDIKRIKIMDCPIFEGLIIATSQNNATNDLDEFAKMIEQESREFKKMGS